MCNNISKYRLSWYFFHGYLGVICCFKVCTAIFILFLFCSEQKRYKQEYELFSFNRCLLSSAIHREQSPSSPRYGLIRILFITLLYKQIFLWRFGELKIKQSIKHLDDEAPWGCILWFFSSTLMMYFVIFFKVSSTVQRTKKTWNFLLMTFIYQTLTCATCNQWMNCCDKFLIRRSSFHSPNNANRKWSKDCTY